MENILLFSLTSNPKLTKAISEELGVEIAPSKVTHFADGEIFAKPLCDVKDRVCFVVQSTCKPVDPHLMEALIFIDALKNGEAKEINLIIPYFGYARQDRIINAADPITTRMVSRFFEVAGTDHIYSCDLHSDKMMSFFDIPVKNIFPSSVLCSYFREKVKEMGFSTKEICVVAPDHGSVNRARHLSYCMDGSTIAFLDKYRPEPNKCLIRGIVGDVKDKVCIIVDDIIDTGGTIVGGVNKLYESGARVVLVGASHGVFSNNAVDRLFAAHIADLVVCDTIENQDPRVHMVSVAGLICDAIREEMN